MTFEQENAGLGSLPNKHWYVILQIGRCKHPIVVSFSSMVKNDKLIQTTYYAAKPALISDQAALLISPFDLCFQTLVLLELGSVDHKRSKILLRLTPKKMKM